MATTTTVVKKFFQWEASGGIVLIAASVLALVCANTWLAPLYNRLLEVPVALSIGTYALSKPILVWVNELLMAIFFFQVGLEIKREFVGGELGSIGKAMLPALAAVGGMVVPAAVYVYFNMADPTNINGWAIPSATDIAFSLGVLSLVGARVPLSLKVLLTAIAIFDDLGAVVVIALFYSSDLSYAALQLAAIAIMALAILNLSGVTRPAAFILVGMALWLCVAKSGVHATLSGVVLAAFIPVRGKFQGESQSPLHMIEHKLHPWVAFAIVPIFGFANAGVSFAGMTLANLFEPVTLGIAAGLFLGKQVGVFAIIWLAVKTGLAKMPTSASWLQIYGIALLCGIGFTMSLFIGTLAFEDDSLYAAPIRLGVLIGSALSAVAGFFVLRAGTPRASETAG